ncbi:glycosyltransferase [Tenacibaculum sp. MEBiC06402]|uniref:glycosyltransferase n=1 Tax=unclassified Tenacibaculum TaxID=2635139 RepID=UPI003B99D9F7
MIDHTFVIPTYKESPYLESCILNLKKQSVSSNIIITTSTPTEQTKNVAEKYKIPYFINDNGKFGIGNDWNFALSKVETKLATIAHQDDIYEDKYTENILKASSNQEKSLLFFTDYNDLIGESIRPNSLNYFIKKTLLLTFLVKKTHHSYFFKKSILVFGDAICCPSVTLNIKNIKNADRLFSPNHKCVLDWIAWLELAKEKGSFTFINKKLIQHRIHESSETSVSLNSGVREQEEFEVFTKIWGKRIAKLLMRFYSFGHKDNIV